MAGCLVSHGKWLSRLEREKRCSWALDYLSRNKVQLVTHDANNRFELRTHKEKLAATVRELERSGGGERIRLLKEAVRQERAAELRAKEGRAIKRLDLGYSARQKLAHHARAARQTQARYIEDMLETEDRLRKVESRLLKNERDKLKGRAALLNERRDELDKRQRDLDLREKSLRKLNGLAEPLTGFIDELLALDEEAVSGVHLPEIYGLGRLQILKSCLAEMRALEAG